ncbi:hypothetical protein FDP41_009858 [Naegleria fowleri]|uniref:Uncharacterized protein n=1 Tax=Naegleria fowleri TaxID=5763 RepID=A0A6A5BBY4_NAEFO|nr:uncharacterized protein FDP41_009858 [Naegleria fowleri]KAF0971635.1 hypothetical protein FDP41_009858 [Naegleria fowleri]
MRKFTASLIQKHNTALYGVLRCQNSIIKRFNSTSSSSGHGEKRTFPKVSNLQDKRNIKYAMLISFGLLGVYVIEKMLAFKLPKPLVGDRYQQ